MKFLLTTIGSSGDINPFIAIGRALQDRGHTATMLINPFFESAARQAGLGYLPLGDEIDFKVMATTKHVTHPRKGGIAVMKQLVIPHMRTIHDTTAAALDSLAPDAVLAHHISVGARWICQQRSIPFATGVLAPCLWLNRNDPSIFGGVPDTLPAPILRAGLWVGKMQCRMLLDPAINRVRRDLGYPPHRDHIFGDAHSGQINLGLWSPAYRPPMDGDPAHGVICGFPWHDRFQRFEQDSADVLRFFDECDRAGEPPILFTLGTAVVHVAGRFYHDAAEAARRLGRRAVLITNRPEYAPAPHDLPHGVKAFSYAPFSQIMPRAACTVHHGGIGTTAQGLRSGRPTVIIPHAYDQFDNAARAKRLGVSATVHRTRVSVNTLVRALREVLDDPAKAPRAAEVAQRLANEDGALTAAQHLERLAQGSSLDAPMPRASMPS